MAPKRTISLPWGRGGGKSWFQRLNWWLQVARWDGQYRPLATEPGVRGVLLMPSLTQARKVHEALTLSELEGRWRMLGGKLDRSEWRIKFPGGSWIQWVTAENARGLRGLRCDFVSVDEADDIDPDLYDAVLTPWFTERDSLRLKMISGTPTRGRYGLLYRSLVRGRDESRPSDLAYHATCYDFPNFVSHEAIAEARRDISDELFKREWLCDFDAAEGLVYSLFDEKFHVRDPNGGTVFSEVIVGGDHGWEDPGCFLVIGIYGSGRDAQAHVIHEVYAQHKTEDWWVDRAREIANWFPSAKWYLDPSRPDRAQGLKTKAGIRLADVDNTIEDGVNCVANLLVKRRFNDDSPEYARLYVARNCPNLIREFGLYRRKRDPRNRERILDDIEDKNNHAMDALRYPLFARFRSLTASGRNQAGVEDRQ